jgi:hypothetical protein
VIGKVVVGRSYRGLANYLLEDGRGQIVAGSMAGRTPRELAAEVGQFRRLNPKLGKAVAHFSLNPAPDDPDLSDEQWQAIAERFMCELGFGDAPWIGVIHRDTYFDGQVRPHLHLAACRISAKTGRTVSDSNFFYRTEEAIRGIERDFGLIAVPDPPRRKPKPTPTTKTTTQGEDAMNDGPGDSQYETWPDVFEPGRNLAVSALVEAIPEAVVPSASVADELTARKRRDIRRIVMEKGYEQHVRAILGSDLVQVYIHTAGAVLYFRESGQIADSGDTLTALNGMPEERAAQHIVALACARNWRSITFTGSPTFIELSMRLAMSNGLRIDARGAQQEAILAKLEAEKRGGMGAMSGMAGPAIKNDPILAPLAELDDIEAQTLPRTAPTPAPVALPPAFQDPQPQPPRSPVVGVTPVFPNLRERLKERRDRLASTQPSPSQPVPPKRPGPRF